MIIFYFESKLKFNFFFFFFFFFLLEGGSGFFLQSIQILYFFVGEGVRGRGARVSEFFIKNPNLK